ncbi:MAG: LacI family DNA-binding transcriptional regulator, partial [Clostridia bacterium]|nr:LacI family DNA-binding transcriptional regulator [Clostridia bacterium]
MMTLTKIAKEAHVSVSTASKAFSGSPEVNEETRELIFQVARAHGCFKKFYNVKYPKLVIGVIAPEFSSMYYTRFLSLIQKNLDHCELCVSTTNFSAERERELIDYYSKHSNVDGLIIIDPLLKPAAPVEIPLVLLWGSKATGGESPEECTSIYTNGSEVMREAIRYLKEKGVTSIGFISENQTAQKERQFCRLMEEEGLPVREEYLCRSRKRFEEGGFQAMETM